MPPVGGQAVIEGVMMQNGDRIAVAVRRESDQAVLVQDLLSRRRFKRLGEIPFVRGVFRLYDMLSLGLRALDVSAKLAYPEEEQIGRGGMTLTLIAGVLIAVGGFVVLPLVLANLIPGLRDGNPILFNLVEGLIRVVFFFAYLVGISQMREIRRVFQYHGAEHMAVFTHEAGEALTVENARRHATLHPRCGTAFLMIVIFVAILVFSIAGNPTLWLKMLSRLLLLPIVAGISYETLRYSGRNADRWWVRILIRPGLWMQRLTTKQPTDDMIEVAIASLKRVTAPSPPETP